MPDRSHGDVLDHVSIQCAFVRDPDGNNVEAVSHTPE